MIQLTSEPQTILKTGTKEIHAYDISDGNIDKTTVASFGEEWLKFNKFSATEIEKIGNDYFDILHPSLKNKNTQVLDMGCGSGRWAYYLAPMVGFIECVDPSEAVFAAATVLKNHENTRIIKADVDNLPFADNSFDLVYSLGVLHHIPDTYKAMEQCVRKVKPGGYFLVYLYYNLDNRGIIFKSIFQLSNFIRGGISKMPSKVKKAICEVIAFAVYLPLAKGAKLVSKLGAKNLSKKIPLSYYGDKSFYIMKNDALDRFGTPLEQRFSKNKIEEMMRGSGLKNIVFSEKEPYWHAIGQKV
ncbi:MAG: putative methyltransferase [Flavisolibacter sp.]|jgi:ubiquinone/menaquinone biosynthesis C-methylase UbiE|nr:putative methyltransferase [Flavisolibacter sp.]